MNYVDEVVFNFPLILTWMTLMLDLVIKFVVIYVMFLLIKALKKYIKS